MTLSTMSCDWNKTTSFHAGHWSWGGKSIVQCQDAALVPADELFGACLELKILEPEQDLLCQIEPHFPKQTIWRVTSQVRVLKGNIDAVQLISHTPGTVDCPRCWQASSAPSDRQTMTFHVSGIFQSHNAAAPGVRFKAERGTSVRVADLKMQEITGELKIF